MMLKNSPPGVTTSLLMAKPRLLMSSGAKITLKGLQNPNVPFCVVNRIEWVYSHTHQHNVPEG